MQDEIICMAREAGFSINDGIVMGGASDLERFAALVAAHERNRHAWTQEHWTEYEHAIAAAEREACAKVCESLPKPTEPTMLTHLQTLRTCAAAIRARSNHAG